jgi:hypothetical protein
VSKYWLVTLFMSVIIGVGSTQEQRTTMVSFGNSPIPEVTLTPLFKSDAHVRDVFGEELTGLRSAAFVLENRSDRPIIAVAVIWKITDQAGMQRERKEFCDSYTISDNRPIINPDRRIVVAPLTFLGEELIEAYRSRSGIVTAPIGTLKRISEEFSQASSISVAVDSIIFSDGEVVGEDSLRYAEEIVTRKKAAAFVVDLVQKARKDGKSPTVDLSVLSMSTPRRDDTFEKSKVRFAQELLKSGSTFDARLGFLASLPEPPKFYRRNSGPRR